ncbi:MAG: porin [Alphaproteobacteria bacterium]|nr:porin [Alphaproteobacteria bacterium]
MSFGRYFLGSVAMGALLMTVVPAKAQSINTQMQSLKAQIQQLNQQLQNLQNQVQQTQQKQAQTDATVDQIKTAPASAQTQTGVPYLTMKGLSPTFSSADGANTLSLTGRLHFDMGDYLKYSKQSPSTTPNDLQSGVKARRARLGVQGKIANDFGYALIMDFGGSSVDNGSTIEAANVTYNGLPIHFLVGYQDTPYTLAEATSSNDIMFLERPSSQTIATEFGSGDNRSAIGAWWNNDRAWVGVFGTGNASGNSTNGGASGKGVASQLAMTGRATYQLVQTPDATFHVGVDADALIKPPVVAANSFRGLALSDSPELRIDNQTILNTGTIGSAGNPVTGGHVLGPELAGNIGPLYGQAEYFHYTVAREGLSDLNFNGGYVEASYALTGEQRHYKPGAGAYASIAPAHYFAPASGYWGAWEVAARYSVIDLNDKLGSATGVAGGKQQTYTVGVNWYPSSNLRFMLDYIHAKVDKLASATSGTQTGATVDAIALRSQFAF